MQLKHVNYAFVVYLALIEALSLVVLDFTNEVNFSIFNGFIVGFVPALIVLLLYRVISPNYPVKFNGKEILKLPVLYLSVVNGLFIFLLFLIQGFLPNPDGLLGNAFYGFFSVFLSSLILIAIYGGINFKVKFTFGMKEVKLNDISVYASLCAGLFEFFILPLMALFYNFNIPSFINGLLAGFIGGTIALYLLDSLLEKKPIEMSL